MWSVALLLLTGYPQAPSGSRRARRHARQRLPQTASEECRCRCLSTAAGKSSPNSWNTSAGCLSAIFAQWGTDKSTHNHSGVLPASDAKPRGAGGARLQRGTQPSLNGQTLNADIYGVDDGSSAAGRIGQRRSNIHVVLADMDFDEIPSPATRAARRYRRAHRRRVAPRDAGSATSRAGSCACRTAAST